MMHSKILKKHYLVPLIVVVIGLLVGWVVFSNDSSEQVIEVAYGEVSQFVSVSGQAKAREDVDLAFEDGGQVSAVMAKVGDKVSAGQALARLKQDQAYADLLSAEASLDYELALLSDAKTDLVSVERALDDGLRNAYTEADNAVKNYVNKFFVDPNSPSSRFGITFDDDGQTVYLVPSNQASGLPAERRQVLEVLVLWKKDISNPVFYNNKTEALRVSRERLVVVNNLLANLASVVNSINTVDVSYISILNSYKSDIATARNNINNVLGSLSSDEQSWLAAKASSAAIGSGGYISTQAAQIKQAEAEVAAKKAALNRLTIVSPIDGVITSQEAEVGEAVTAGQVVTSVISAGQFEIEANVPEVDIGRLMIGQKASLRFDAFPDEVFTGQVFYIEPSETIIDGVTNYKTKISLDQADDRLKSGLTASLEIITVNKENVLVIPRAAVTENGNKRTVLKVVGGNQVETDIILGEVGMNGLVEVLGGLTVGDQVLVP